MIFHLIYEIFQFARGKRRYRRPPNNQANIQTLNKDVSAQKSFSQPPSAEGTIFHINHYFKLPVPSHNPAISHATSQLPAFTISNPGISWSQIVALEPVANLLLDSAIYSFTKLNIFSSQPNLNSPKSILLYGPSGTGKTLLAQALATEAHSHNTPQITFFSASSTNLLSKYLDESEKLISRLFTSARHQAPSIIFFDEISWLFRKFTEPINEWEEMDNIRRHFIRELENAKTENIFVFATTNIPWTLRDEVIWDLFEQKVGLSLPDSKARMEIINKLLENVPHCLTEKELKMLAEQTNNYSGSDLKALVNDVLLGQIRKISDNLEETEIEFANFEASLLNIKASLKDDEEF